MLIYTAQNYWNYCKNKIIVGSESKRNEVLLYRPYDFLIDFLYRFFALLSTGLVILLIILKSGNYISANYFLILL